VSEKVFEPEGEAAKRAQAYADRQAHGVTCPKCGRPLSAADPEGLCSQCLLRAALGKPAPAPTTELPPPLARLNQRIGDYELLDEIGRGGMGVVYRARQVTLNRIVALKLMRMGPVASEKAKQRVRNEAQIAGRLQHPNIVAVYAVAEQEGAPYIAMEYVEGQTLDPMARIGPFKPGLAAELVQTLAQAVHYAHQRGVIHLDLKPSNVLVDGARRPRITDFGLAKHLESDLGLTASGEALGTPSFIPPEQANPKRGQVSPATDVYALGGILYYLLAGRPPFCAETRDEVVRQVLEDDPVAPRRLNASIPLDLQTICLKCLDKNPGRRYATAEELADDLGRFVRKEPIRAKPAHIGIKLRRWSQRQPRVAALLGGLLLISALAAFFFLVAMGAVVVNWQRAELNAKEQKRLREIAEEALRGLENQTSSYQTSGVFRFKVPQGFILMTGERLGVLKQAMLKNLTLQQSKDAMDAMGGSVKKGMRQGMDYARSLDSLPRAANKTTCR
jgi:eukaryotic-like serine/threonine-protein kinase